MGSGFELSERQQYWLKHIEACDDASEATKTYAELHGLSVSMMYSWRKKLSAMGVLSGNSRRRDSGRFDRVQVVHSEPLRGECHIALPNGVRIGFSGSVDGGMLRAVLEAVSRL